MVAKSVLSNDQFSNYLQVSEIQEKNHLIDLNEYIEQPNNNKLHSQDKIFDVSSSTGELDENDLEEDSTFLTYNIDQNKKHNHSKIEKRRRDKMNTYLSELSTLIPMCYTISRKLDKLTVLKMAVQYLKKIHNTVQSYKEGHCKPAFLSDEEHRKLISQIADGFLFIVTCERGRILYVSESISTILNYPRVYLLGQSLFDIMHPKDMNKIKEQLSSSDSNSREIIDSKKSLPIKNDFLKGANPLLLGSRRTFFSRMKTKCLTEIKSEEKLDFKDSTRLYIENNKKDQKKKSCDTCGKNKKFETIFSTGYLKSWTTKRKTHDDGIKNSNDYNDNVDNDDESFNLTCLVAIGRILPTIKNNKRKSQKKTNSIFFISRHSPDGKFIYIDENVTLILGYLPQELLGTSMYEYYHCKDVTELVQCHKIALQSEHSCNEYITSKPYQFRTSDGTYVILQTMWRAFKNPWTKEIESLIAKNILILSNIDSSRDVNLDMLKANRESLQKVIQTYMESSKIGREIAKQTIEKT